MSGERKRGESDGEKKERKREREREEKEGRKEGGLFLPPPLRPLTCGAGTDGATTSENTDSNDGSDNDQRQEEGSMHN